MSGELGSLGVVSNFYGEIVRICSCNANFSSDVKILIISSLCISETFNFIIFVKKYLGTPWHNQKLCLVGDTC